MTSHGDIAGRDRARRPVRRLPPAHPDKRRLADRERTLVPGLKPGAATVGRAEPGRRSALGADASRRGPATRTRPASSSATASACSGSATATGSPTILLMPTWSIVHSRHWKPQIPYLARHFRVVTFDGRGNGRSDRPPTRRLRRHGVRRRRRRRPGRDRHRPGGGRRAVDGRRLSRLGSRSSTRTASLGLCLFGSTVPVAIGKPSARTSVRCGLRGAAADDEGWQKYNAHYWRRDWPGFAAWFFGEADVHGAALDQADRGRGRLGPRDGPRDDDRRRARPVPRPPAAWDAPPARGPRPGVPAARRVSRPGRPRHRRPRSSPIGHRPAARGSARAPARRDRGRRPLADRSRPVLVEPPDPRLRPRPGGRRRDRPTRRPRRTDVAFDRDSGRARLPDRSGFATAADGVRLAFDVYGSGEPTIVLLPSTPIVHSRQWKAQIPYLSRHYRVVDLRRPRQRPLGSADRPGGVRRRPDRRRHRGRDGRDRHATRRARRPVRRRRLAGDPARGRRSPERVARDRRVRRRRPAAVAAAPVARSQYAFDDELPTDEGWAKLNRHYWRRDYPGFARFFFAAITSEPHSTKAIEDAVGWALDGSVDAMLAERGRAVRPSTARRSRRSAARSAARCSSSTAPRTTASRSRAPQRLAELTGAPLVVVEGADHMIPGRHPVLANLLIRDFVDSLDGGARR